MTEHHIALLTLLENPILFEFVIGGWLAKFYLDGFTISKKQTYFIFLFSMIWLLLFFYSPWLWKLNSIISRSPIAIGLFIIAVFYAPIRDCKVPRLFVYLGDASYSIYLFHMFPIMILSGVLKKIPLSNFLNLPVIISWILITVISILFGCFIYSLVEKKLNTYTKKLLIK